MLRIFLFFFGVVFSDLVQAENSVIRVRLLQNLTDFPKVLQAQVKQVSPTIWSLHGRRLSFEEKKLSTTNFVFKKPNGLFDLVGIFDFDNYLAGVVSKEMPLSWPLEALKAQAVIARSYALAKVRERPNRIFHIDATQMDQVFAVTNSEKARLAVFLTDNIVLTDEKNKVLKAFYHADCGGQTIPASKVWQGAVDTGTATDPWCLERKSNEWSFSTTAEDFNEKLGVAGIATAIEVFKNRIQALELSDQIFSVQKIRHIFGYSQIRNSPLSIEQNKAGITFKGKGYGHGAGLCQWGAFAQAKQGRSYSQILSHYYPSAQQTQNRVKLSKSFMADLVFN